MQEADELLIIRELPLLPNTTGRDTKTQAITNTSSGKTNTSGKYKYIIRILPLLLGDTTYVAQVEIIKDRQMNTNTDTYTIGTGRDT